MPWADHGDERLREIDRVAAEGPFTASWDSLTSYEVPSWYQDGKFGIFIHWGAYAVPAFGSEWYPRNMYLQGSPEYEHHLKTYGSHVQFGYKDFIPQFTADLFDPDAWAALFRRAGAQFVVPVAEHHDGFAMYDSDHSAWTAAKMGPRRDVIGELAAAVRRQWMVFGVSSHRAEHWWFMNGGMAFDSDIRDPAYADLYGPAQSQALPPNEAFLQDWLMRCCELVDKYRPQLFWFDWWIEQPAFAPYLPRFAAYYYNRAASWQRGVAINYKHTAFAEGSAVFDVERGQLAEIRADFWQADTAVAKNSWSYTENNEYKEAGDIIGDLVDIVSKNGALLLNIGPKADGTIPDGDRAILLEIGAWLLVNGDAIYGTRPWVVYGEGPTPIVEGSFSDTKRQSFTSRDIRFTTREATIYATALAIPETRELTITTLRERSSLVNPEIARVELVGGGELAWTRDEEGLHVALPDNFPARHAISLRIATVG
jgi:alpha-L-fucosidase